MKVDVEKLLQRLGIEAKRRGREWFAKCPNPEHDDHDPSWRIRDEPGATKHGFHHCWPCGFQGTAIVLVQRVLGIESYADARRWIEEGGIVDQREVEAVVVRTIPHRGRFKLPEGVRVEPIANWPGPARDYFLKTRRLEEWLVEKWGIGYAVEGRLSGRIVFVLRDAAGRPTGYSARTFVGDAKRFLEPDAPERASPSAMFGEQHWPARRDVVFVFEGAIKALAADASLEGICVAATTGSELRPMHVTKLATFGTQVLIGDSDKAGSRLNQALEDGLARHGNPRRLALPKDADELSRDELRTILMGWLSRWRDDAPRSAP